MYGFTRNTTLAAVGGLKLQGVWWWGRGSGEMELKVAAHVKLDGGRDFSGDVSQHCEGILNRSVIAST